MSLKFVFCCVVLKIISLFAKILVVVGNLLCFRSFGLFQKF